MCAALQLACELGADKRLVTILCDTGERYLSLSDHFQESNGIDIE
jgi:cysteine synthase